MAKELVIVCAIWYIGIFASLWVVYTGNLKIALITPNIVRDSLLMIVSSFIPLFLSFKEENHNEPLTLDYLKSMELILENEETLKAFDEFLKVSVTGE